LKVCIAEKPSVAKEIAEILGANQRKDGYFEGNGYQVTWTFGHLCGLKEPHEYDTIWKQWNLYTLPILPPRFGIKLIENKGVEKQFNTISHLLNNADEIINCGDAGQEGELIQRWVIAKTKCNKPVKRLWISSLTEEAIREGFKNLKDAKEFDSLYAAGSSRAIGDWLLGMNATRLYTVKYGQDRQVLSIGRVQTPTLALIINRHLEIENFKSQTYWELKTVYRDVTFSSNKGKITSKEKGEEFFKGIKDADFTITSIETKKGKESAPRLFDLTSLQVECNKKFGLSADETLKTIQILYEKKLVTYPRVDTTYLPNDLYPKIEGILKSMRGYADLTKILLAKTITKSSKVFDDKKVTDHHAIIPTNITAPVLNGSEAKVYDMISKRFIAAFYPDCEISNTVVLGKVKDFEFKATGKQILFSGWRVVYQLDTQIADDSQEDNQLLPEFVKGEIGPHQPLLAEKNTQPPKHYTEATLLRAMETAGKQVEDEELRDAMKDNGIGRPSTRAAIIETLFKRNYVRKERKNLIPTVTGIALIKTINNEMLKSVELTGQWEHKLRLIEKKEYEASVFLEEMKKMVNDLVDQVRQEQVKKIPTESIETKTSVKSKVSAGANCPKCKSGKILKGKAAFGCSDYKIGCDFKLPMNYCEINLSEEQANALASGKKVTIKNAVINGKKITGFFKLKSDHSITFEEKETIKKEKVMLTKLCPKCKNGEIIEGKAAFGCSNWKAGCKTVIPFEYLGKKISEAQLQQLLAKQETGVIKGLTENGKKINAKLVFTPNFQLNHKIE